MKSHSKTCLLLDPYNDFGDTVFKDHCWTASDCFEVGTWYIKVAVIYSTVHCTIIIFKARRTFFKKTTMRKNLIVLVHIQLFEVLADFESST